MALPAPQSIPETDIIRKVKQVVDYNADLLISDGNPTPTGFSLLTAGGDELPVDLTADFVTREEFVQDHTVPPATEEESGRIKIVTEAKVNEATDDTDAMTVLKTLLLLAKKGVPNFDLKDAADDQVLLVAHDGEGGLLVRSASVCELVSQCGDNPTPTPTPTPTVAVANFIIDGHFIEQDPDYVRVTAPNAEWQGVIGATPKPGVFRVTGADTLGRVKETYHAEEQLTDNSWRTYSGTQGDLSFALNTPIAGLAIDAATGEVDATGYTNPADTNFQVNATIGANTIAKAVKVLSSTLAVLALDYAWQKNNPPTSASILYLWLKQSATGDLELATEVLGPPAFALPKSGYTGMNAGDYGNGYTKYTSIYNAGGTSLYRIYIRKVGSTSDLAIVELPALPNSGNVSRQKIYPAT